MHDPTRGPIRTRMGSISCRCAPSTHPHTHTHTHHPGCRPSFCCACFRDLVDARECTKEEAEVVASVAEGIVSAEQQRRGAREKETLCMYARVRQRRIDLRPRCVRSVLRYITPSLHRQRTAIAGGKGEEANTPVHARASFTPNTPHVAHVGPYTDPRPLLALLRHLHKGSKACKRNRHGAPAGEEEKGQPSAHACARQLSTHKEKFRRNQKTEAR